MELQARKRILLVDDEKDFLEATGAYLRSLGYDVVTAASGEGALNVVSESRPDLILLDIILPKMKGVEVCMRLKSDPVTENIPIIFMTAITSGNHTEVLLKMGAEDYLVKPCSAEELEDKIKISLIRHDAFLSKKAA